MFGVAEPGIEDDDEWCDKCKGLPLVKLAGWDGELGRCEDGCVNCTFGDVLLNAELVFGALDGTDDDGTEALKRIR